MNLYLIRHGEKMSNDKNHDMLELTEKGFQQAELLGERLARQPMDIIYSSSMKRALQTAETINKYLHREIIVRPDLREVHMGISEREGWDSLVRHYPEFMREWYKRDRDLRYPPDGESGEDVWNRASKVIEEIVATDYENVAVVAHGGTIRILICGFLKLSQARRFCLGQPTENCSISIVKYDKAERQYYVHSFNDYAHLGDLTSAKT